jgi:hypothetical protein
MKSPGRAACPNELRKKGQYQSVSERLKLLFEEFLEMFSVSHCWLTMNSFITADWPKKGT